MESMHPGSTLVGIEQCDGFDISGCFDRTAARHMIARTALSQ